VFRHTISYEAPWQEYPGAVFETVEQANGALRLYIQQAGQNIQRNLDDMLFRLRLKGGVQPGTPIYKHITD